MVPQDGRDRQVGRDDGGPRNSSCRTWACVSACRGWSLFPKQVLTLLTLPLPSLFLLVQTPNSNSRLLLFLDQQFLDRLKFQTIFSHDRPCTSLRSLAPRLVHRPVLADHRHFAGLSRHGTRMVSYRSHSIPILCEWALEFQARVAGRPEVCRSGRVMKGRRVADRGVEDAGIRYSTRCTRSGQLRRDG